MSKPRHLISCRQPIALLECIAAHEQCSLRKGKALLDERRVLVNGRRVWMARHRLRPGDEVEILPATTTVAASRASVLLETSDFLIVDKPAGILSNGPDSLESLLRQQRGEGALRAVHRLDRNTTGCLCLARRAAAEARARRCFEAGGVVKLYQAIVHGCPAQREGTITQRIDGQPALSHWRVLAATDAAAWVQLKIDTGRTHQIRKHLSAIGHPVLGDRQYFTARLDDPRLRAVPRQMLHAASFQAPLGERDAVLRVSAPLPADFKRTLRAFGLRPARP
jgi:23S rRNA pseudouridine1911/1915/1917 synthase